MDWESAKEKEGGAVEIPKRWLLLHYYEALNILFRMENALRVFVYVVLKNRYGEKWAETALQTVDEEQSTIAAVASKRVAQAKGYGYLGYEVGSPLMYLNSGELTRIITSDSYWDLFKPHFRGKREIIKIKLDEIGTVRNSLAHFRPVKHDDIALIKQNVNHVFVGIEQYLSEMTQADRVVPTNTEGDWYKNLSSIESRTCKTQLFQDRSDRWIRVEINYDSAILQSSSTDRFRSFQVTNLIPPRIVESFLKLFSFVTFMTEYVPHVRMSADGVPRFRKLISLVVSKAVLLSAHAEVANHLNNLLAKIDTETELVQQDNLARGQIIDSVHVWSYIENDRWTTNAANMKNEFTNSDPSEYWGEMSSYRGDFVAGVTKYPWMPSDISKEEDIFF
ncbi:Swt1 family HEPN domain-containing protein [Bradyrhizobium sp. PUT101]|uniref:Swt1 family HEPN domain-containing protein n=1 Tax=Bradyrhizobium sp. PUT101 TaxID=3447427 RepID=UPI003F86FD67